MSRLTKQIGWGVIVSGLIAMTLVMIGWGRVGSIFAGICTGFFILYGLAAFTDRPS